jgi:hypothetical protein
MGFFGRRQRSSDDDVDSPAKDISMITDDMIIDDGIAAVTVPSEIHTTKTTTSMKKSRSGGGIKRLFSCGSKKHDITDMNKPNSDTDEPEEEELEGGDVFVSNEGTRLRGPPPTRLPNTPKSFRPSYIQSKITEASNESWNTKASPSTLRNKRSSFNPATAPPPARESAFSGPPRFDWIDIVSVHAIISIIQERRRVLDPCGQLQ